MISNRYNGRPKYSTPDCPTCPYHLEGTAAQRIQARVRFPRETRLPTPLRFCAWGVAIKLLAGENPPHCEFRHKPAPGWKNWQAVLTVPLEACRYGAPYVGTATTAPADQPIPADPAAPEPD